MEKIKYIHRLHSEQNPLHAISQEELLGALSCKGFVSKYDVSSVKHGKRNLVHQNGAWGLDQTATISDSQHTKKYKLHFVEDLDNSGIIVTDGQNTTTYSKIVLRDRSHDGSPEATPPHYLQVINGYSAKDIGERSKKLAFTTWSYSNPSDVIRTGQHAVELSIVSADPEQVLLDRLLKKNRLFVDPKQLSQFIDDPFSYIPFGFSDPKEIDLWWKYWFQVVDRGLRGKEIPQPGQTAQRGFEGFFKHTISASEKLAKECGYTHLTAVPTWTYVFHAFLENGFVPTNKKQAEEAFNFLNSLGKTELLNGEQLSTHHPKDPLFSWLAVAPYVIELNTNHMPNLGIDETREQRFQMLYMNLKKSLQQGDTVLTYPLAPGRNFWLEKKL